MFDRLISTISQAEHTHTHTEPKKVLNMGAEGLWLLVFARLGEAGSKAGGKPAGWKLKPDLLTLNLVPYSCKPIFF